MKNQIGKKINECREIKGVTLDELSERSGVKKEIIEKIENEKISPAINYLIKISRGLSVRLGTFLDDNNECSCVITRKNECNETERLKDDNMHNPAIKFHSLANNKKDRAMEPFAVTLYPIDSEEKKNLSTHEGEEFIYVISGNIEIIHGKDKYNLETGDSIYYDSAVPHTVYPSGIENAFIVAVIYIP